MPSTAIKNVIVIGATGNIGIPIVLALIAANFTVSITTRSTTSLAFPPNVKVITTDYSPLSLLRAFQNQDAAVSAIATFSISQQISMIDAAILSGIKRFIPSEFGLDTLSDEIRELLPHSRPKYDTLAYLRSKEMSGMSWTGICVGQFFDWSLQNPGHMGWDVPARTATIFDGGDVLFEATTVAQVGKAVAAVLSAENLETTRNEYIYVNSFTVTQNQVLAVLEKHTGCRFEITQQKSKELLKEGMDKMSGQEKILVITGGLYVDGVVEIVTALTHSPDALNHYSQTRELWNMKLGLPEEDIEDCVRNVVLGFVGKGLLPI